MEKNDSLATKKLFFVLFFFMIPIFCNAQGSPDTFWDKVRYGGGFGVGFGNSTFNASLSPSAIYDANDQWAFGAGLTGNYASFGDDELIAYGGNLLSLYNPIPFLQFSVEFEQLRVHREFSSINGGGAADYWSPGLFLGLGYSNDYVTFGLRYNILYDIDRSIYADALVPFVRIYF